jgi:hypothetical protein
MHPDEETLDSQVLANDEPEPELELSLAGDANSDSYDLDPDMLEDREDLPAESFEADPDDEKGSHYLEQPEDS